MSSHKICIESVSYDLAGRHHKYTNFLPLDVQYKCLVPHAYINQRTLSSDPICIGSDFIVVNSHILACVLVHNTCLHLQDQWEDEVEQQDDEVDGPVGGEPQLTGPDPRRPVSDAAKKPRRCILILFRHCIFFLRVAELP